MGTFEAAQKAGNKSTDKQVAATTKSLTKRQRRKDLQNNSDKNKWLIQHPKVQSMDRREQMQVKDAGLNETKAEKRQAPIDPKLDLMSPEVKFGRLLAGTDQRKRHAAVKKLKAYLKARCDIAEVVSNDGGDGDGDNNNSGGISELDLLKLWKALWYTLYMADKKPVQDELSKHVCKLLWCVVGTEEEDECAGRAYLEMTEAEELELADCDDDEYDVTLEEIENTLKEIKDSDDDDDENSEESDNEMEEAEDDDEAMMQEQEEASDEMMEMDDAEIPHCRGAHLVSLFVRTFFRTIRRDWGSMDKYRIDKFYTLIRMMMHEIYEYMSVRCWNYGIVLLLNDAIFDEILKIPPNGLRYHLIDLCLEELAKVNAKAKVPLTEATFLDVLEPFFGLCQTGRHDDTVQERVMDKIMDNFLENYSVVSDKALQEDDDDNKEDSGKTSLIFNQVHVKTLAEFLFTLGSDPTTKDKYRKSLYDMHKKYMRRLKQIGKDVEITTDEDGNEIYDDDGVGDDVNINNIDESIQFLEAETNEEMQDDSGDDSGDVDTDEPAEKVEVEKPKKESKKKKKKKRKSMEPEADPEPDVTPDSNDAKADEKKKSKKKKRKSDSGESAAADEEVVITLTEQQDAKTKDRKAKKKLKEQQKEDEKESLVVKDEQVKKGSRRVSFGAKNRAKSHKASMKALRTSEPPSTKETTPVKGILRQKPRHKSKISKMITGLLPKKSRKKATSYF